MQFPSILVSLLFATAVAAKGDGNKTLSTAGQCKEMRKLTQVVNLAANTTKLEEVTKNNATKIAAIQAKASAASTTLATLQSNTTLMSECAVINAANEQNKACEQTFALQKFIAFANNQTAVTAATKDNATKAASIQAKASAASTKLDALMSNTTLQAACPAVLQKDQCKIMSGLQKFVDTANNQTKLTALTKGNTTKMEKIMQQAQKAQTKLADMMSNATLVSACDALKTTAQKGTSASAAAASASASSTMKSAAVKGLENGGSWVLSVIVVAAAMFML